MKLWETLRGERVMGESGGRHVVMGNSDMVFRVMENWGSMGVMGESAKCWEGLSHTSYSSQGAPGTRGPVGEKGDQGDPGEDGRNVSPDL